ncbi:hypothetical protein B7494_g8501 [Chlorociboria aeruginascens]|nr:hypothetical protein B7494_g8501 [Chlorociboria aeruginascens]
MTTIDEMDEFFNFEDAATPVDPAAMDFNLPSGAYDIDLAFADLQNDEDSFTCLQHFTDSGPEDQCLDPNDTSMDTSMLSAEDFTDFPRFIEGMDVPTSPCEYCQRMKIHCKILKEGRRRGACTSCVALARSCSLNFPCPPGQYPFTYTPRELCNYCRSRGLECDVLLDGDRAGSCKNCSAVDRRCSFTPHQNSDSWNIDERMNSTNRITAKSSQEPERVKRSDSDSSLGAPRLSDENLNAENERGPKIGARFSRDSVRILRGWLSTHHRHPYPTDEEKESLQRQTGLNKTQITNWLANARRRGKVRAPRSTSPSVNNYAKGMDIPRRATPALENMNPMERWQHSPPEHEPASVTAIAKAVTSSTFSSGRESPLTSYGHTDDSGRSLCNASSASSFGSLGTSHSSGGSFASAFSHKSRGSFGSFDNRGRRRRRRQASKPVKVSTLVPPIRTFQCTFCTETFKTKHDWQRHEKSLHLSLERWVCSPDGPSMFCDEYNHLACVFCGLPNPPQGHFEEHNYSSCAERSLEERTFYRKDHLRQHLNLVHNVKFAAWSMESWKVATPEIRSRCGFCGIVMDSWTIRVDHLAEHFKGGKSMADWKGDWGFESQVLEIVENGMPPYLIHDERNTLNPYIPSKETNDLDRSIEYLIKNGLVHYINQQRAQGIVPTDDGLLLKAREIILKAEATSEIPECDVSWFRDLFMFSEIHDSSLEGSSKPSSPGVLQPPRPRNPHTMIGQCPKEGALRAFVSSRQALGLVPTDSELQVEACRILDQSESASRFKCQGAAQWFKYLITASQCWLAEFRRRASLPRTSEMAVEHIRPTDDKSIDYTILNYPRLMRELKDYVQLQLALGTTPTDLELQEQARLIIYGNDDSWNQTAFDDPAYLHLFKRQNGLAPSNDDSPNLLPPIPQTAELEPRRSSKTLHWDLDNTTIILPGTAAPSPMSAEGFTRTFTPEQDKPLHTLVQNQPSTNTNPPQQLKYFLNDANCYARLVRELSRFVASCMSPNNPNQHIPTDAEIQNQARWAIYDDDDPWNQTAADNAEWLSRFKRDVGLAPASSGPGLPTSSTSWQVAMGGSGFSPPYLCPSEIPAAAVYQDDVSVRLGTTAKTCTVSAKTAKSFVRGLSAGRYQKPAAVFCSRELEQGLRDFVRLQMESGWGWPSDERLRQKARDILGEQETAADDVELLRKFREVYDINTDTHSNPMTIDLETGELSKISDEMMADFDRELQISNLENPGSGMGTPSDGAGDALLDPILTNAYWDMQAVGEEAQREYADVWRVSTTTTSPLGRKALVGNLKKDGASRSG